MVYSCHHDALNALFPLHHSDHVKMPVCDCLSVVLSHAVVLLLLALLSASGHPQTFPCRLVREKEEDCTKSQKWLCSKQFTEKEMIIILVMC